MSDTPQTQPPGWYYAQGDPPGTQRYWDGQKWEGGPQPVPGAGQDAMAGAGGVPGLAEPIMRIGARVIDYIVWIIVNVIFSALFVGSVVATGNLEEVSYIAALLSGLLTTLVIAAYEAVMVGTQGATLGKMALGLKVVRADGSAPDLKDGLMRILPYLALSVLSALVPFFGIIAFLVFVVVAIVSLVFLFTDAKRQTVWDKVAKTLVVSGR